MDTKEIITTLMYTGLQVHIFHLQTTSYAEHMALGSLYDAIQDATDTFAEALIGNENGKRPSLKTQFELSDYAEGTAAQFVEQFVDWLNKIGNLPTDVLNMRDDLLAKAHKTRYLLSLDSKKEAESEEQPEAEGVEPAEVMAEAPAETETKPTTEPVAGTEEPPPQEQIPPM